MGFKKGHGRFRSDESYRKAAKKIAANPNSAKTRFKKGSSGFTGKHTEKTKQKIRIARARQGSNVWNKGKKYKAITGQNHWNWKGGITKVNKPARYLFMETLEYKQWRTAVFERDNYTCVWCGSKKNLNADHIKPYAKFPKLRLSIKNGRTLCVPCHIKTDSYGNKK